MGSGLSTVGFQDVVRLISSLVVGLGLRLSQAVAWFVFVGGLGLSTGRGVSRSKVL